MQISKLLPVVVMGIVSLGLISARAQDTPEQAAARAALMEKMADLDQAQSPATASAPAAPETPATPGTPPPSSDTTSTPVVVSAPTAAAPVANPPMQPSTPPPAPMTSQSEFSPVPPPSGAATIAVTPSASFAGHHFHTRCCERTHCRSSHGESTDAALDASSGPYDK